MIDVALTFNGSGNENVVDVYPDVDFANGVSLKSVSDMVCEMDNVFALLSCFTSIPSTWCSSFR